MKKIIPVILSLTPLLFSFGLTISYLFGNSIVKGPSEITAVPNFEFVQAGLNVLFLLFIFTIIAGLFFLVSDLINKERRLKSVYVFIFLSSMLLSRVLVYVFEVYMSVNIVTWFFG